MRDKIILKIDITIVNSADNVVQSLTALLRLLWTVTFGERGEGGDCVGGYGGGGGGKEKKVGSF